MTFLMNAWYCAALSDEVGHAPIARQLLGLRVMLVRDGKGSVRAMNDRCPHRFAPLHKGRFEKDMIECPYHGLRFDLNGRCVHNPHGSRRIPGGSTVLSYPVAECEGVVWFWPGNPELADRDALPKLNLFPRGGAPLSGHITMKVDYRLVIDNLLDLTHASYLHGGSLAPDHVTPETEFDESERMLCSRYMLRDVETPASQALTYPQPRGDFFSDMEWIAPSILRHSLGMTEPGRPRDEGGVWRAAHLITPASGSQTHYFWFMSRNRHVDNQEMDEQLRTIINHAFMNEDEPMIAACQDYMDGEEFFSLKPLYLDTDFAGARYRRILEKLIAAE